jgi:hypothetical protein
MMTTRISRVIVFAAAVFMTADSWGADWVPAPLVRPLPLVSDGLALAVADTGRAFIDMSRQQPERQISLQKALFLSVLLPGAGEYYAGERFRGQIFMGIEAAIWSSFAAMRVYGGWKTDDYRSYAAAHAAVDNSGKNDQFYDWIGFYNNRDEFNQLGRLYYPERAYLPDTRAYYWQWDSDVDRQQYKQIKDTAKRVFRNSTFMLGLALINRIVSGIDTYRTVTAAKRKMGSLTQFGDYKLKISPRLAGQHSSIHLVVSRKF